MRKPQQTTARQRPLALHQQHVVARHVDKHALIARDDAQGRFIACRTGFYDPALFEPNREVTFTGRIEGYEKRKVEGYVYDFPRVAADVIYLWPKRERVDVVTRTRHPTREAAERAALASSIVAIV